MTNSQSKPASGVSSSSPSVSVSNNIAHNPPVRRRPRQTNPLVVRKNGVRLPSIPLRSRPVVTPDNKSVNTLVPGNVPTSNAAKSATPNTVHENIISSVKPASSALSHKDELAGQAADVEKPYREIPVYITPRNLLAQLRHHVIRFQSDRPIDPTDQEEWVRPVRLHRRDPRLPSADAKSCMDGAEGADGAEEEEKEAIKGESERERLHAEAVKAERRRIREENQALIAPTASNAGKMGRSNHFGKRFEQVFQSNDSPEAIKRARLKYEETLPWHLEDYDIKRVWMGTFESELSEKSLMFIKEPGASPDSSQIRIVPLEKWYRFKEKTKFRFLTAEEAEAHMNKKFKDPRWFMAAQRAAEAQKELERSKTVTRGRLFKIKNEMPNRDSSDLDALGSRDDTGLGHIDDMDFDEKEEFADDDEGELFDSHDKEAAKITEERVRKEQYGANVFGLADEKQIDREEKREQKLIEMQKKLEKSTRKVLLRKEKNIDFLTSDDEDEYNYDDSDPYASGTSDDDTDREKRGKPSTADPNGPKSGNGNGNGNASSSGSGSGYNGISTSNVNTSGNATNSSKVKCKETLSNDKTANNNKKGLPTSEGAVSSSLSALKRPALSPEEGANQETSRKKLKKVHSTSSASSISSSSALPSNVLPSHPVKKEATLANLPNGKLAAAAVVPGEGLVGGASCTDSGESKKPPRRISLMTPEQIKAKIPPEGIDLKALVAVFKASCDDEEDTKKFVSRVKSIAYFDPKTRRVFQK